MPPKRPDTSVSKKCSCCKEIKHPDLFYKCSNTFDQKSTYCKTCQNEKNKAAKKRYDKNKVRDWRLRNLHGMEHGTYDLMISAQSGKCAICKGDDPGNKGYRFHVDHCHDTDVVRGLLCRNCNIGLGYFKQVELLQAAAEYLINYPTKTHP